jgi:hypothetical protein
MNRVRRFLALSPGERRLLLAATGVVLLTKLLVVVFPLATARSSLRTAARLGRRHDAERKRAPDVEAFAWSVSVAGGHLPRARCLSQAVALQTLLERYDHDSTFVIGVREPGAETFEAHAWIEVDGAVVIGDRPDLSTYRTLPVEPRPPGARAVAPGG